MLDKMKKDGTCYLCKIVFETGEVGYQILKWGEPSFLSPESGKRWVNSVGMVPRLKSVLNYIDCRVLELDLENMLKELADTASSGIASVGSGNYRREREAQKALESKYHELRTEIKKLK